MSDPEDNKHDAVMQWMFQNEDLKRLYFNFSDSAVGNVVLATSSGNRNLKTYLDGSEIKAYDFSIILYKPLNTVDVNSNENAEIMFDAEKMMEWLDKQEERKNYPIFPGCFVTKVENLQNMPSVAGMNDTEAKYLFSCRITYLQPKR